MADHHQAVGENPVIGPGIPVGLDPPGLDELFHVAHMGQDRQVGIKTRGNRTGLGAGGVVRLLELHVATRLALPPGGKRGDQAIVEDLANHRVGAELERVGRRVPLRLASTGQGGQSHGHGSE